MADLSKLKTTKNRFGNFEETETTQSNNLEAPEVAPRRPQKSRKKTGRTERFGTSVSPQFLQDLNETAFKMGMKKVEVLEIMLEEYRKNKGF